MPPERTAREVEFIIDLLPAAAFVRILDVACGSGRHALPLAARGYGVTGWDVDDAALDRARRAATTAGIGADTRPRAVGGTAFFERRDMRTLHASHGPFDAILCLWSSFGFFDDATNTRVLQGMAAALRPGGRLLLDLYDRAWFVSRVGERVHHRDGIDVHERTALTDGRLRVELAWPDGHRDAFDWEAFTADELAGRCAGVGLRELCRCADFNREAPAAGLAARMQLLLEKPGG